MSIIIYRVKFTDNKGEWCEYHTDRDDARYHFKILTEDTTVRYCEWAKLCITCYYEDEVESFSRKGVTE